MLQNRKRGINANLESDCSESSECILDRWRFVIVPAQCQDEDNNHSDSAGFGPLNVFGHEPSQPVPDIKQKEARNGNEKGSAPKAAIGISSRHDQERECREASQRDKEDEVDRQRVQADLDQHGEGVNFGRDLKLKINRQIKNYFFFKATKIAKRTSLKIL